MVQCCKITGFPQCFLLFVRLCHGNLEPVHVGDSGLSCKAPHSGIHDVSGSCAKAFLRLLSDSSTQELHCRNEEITVGLWRRERKMKNSSEVWLQDTLHQIYLTQFTRLSYSSSVRDQTAEKCLFAVHFTAHGFLVRNIENPLFPFEWRSYCPFPFPNGNLQHLLILHWKKRPLHRLTPVVT